MDYNKIYINEAEDIKEKELKLKHDEELEAKIQAKKAEIRARKELEKKGGTNE